MPSYLSLINWTEQGIGNVKESPERLDAAKQAVEAAASVLLTLGSQGSIRSTTMRAFTEEEYRTIIGNLP